MLVTLTRAEATAKQLDEGQPVWIKPVAGASQIASSAGVPVESDLGALSEVPS